MVAMDPSALVDVLERITVGAVGLTTRALTQAAPGVELTFQQWRAILILGERPDGQRISEVAARVGVTLPATGRLLRRLEGRGLVVLATDDEDRRATRARLSPSGREVRAEIVRFRRRALRAIAKAAAGAQATGPDGSDEALHRIATEFGTYS